MKDTNSNKHVLMPVYYGGTRIRVVVALFCNIHKLIVLRKGVSVGVYPPRTSHTWRLHWGGFNITYVYVPVCYKHTGIV